MADKEESKAPKATIQPGTFGGARAASLNLKPKEPPFASAPPPGTPQSLGGMSTDFLSPGLREGVSGIDLSLTNLGLSGELDRIVNRTRTVEVIISDEDRAAWEQLKSEEEERKRKREEEQKREKAIQDDIRDGQHWITSLTQYAEKARKNRAKNSDLLRKWVKSPPSQLFWFDDFYRFRPHAYAVEPKIEFLPINWSRNIYDPDEKKGVGIELHSVFHHPSYAKYRARQGAIEGGLNPETLLPYIKRLIDTPGLSSKMGRAKAIEFDLAARPAYEKSQEGKTKDHRLAGDIRNGRLPGGDAGNFVWNDWVWMPGIIGGVWRISNTANLSEQLKLIEDHRRAGRAVPRKVHMDDWLDWFRQRVFAPVAWFNDPLVIKQVGDIGEGTAGYSGSYSGVIDDLTGSSSEPNHSESAGAEYSGEFSAPADSADLPLSPGSTADRANAQIALGDLGWQTWALIALGAWVLMGSNSAQTVVMGGGGKDV